MSDLKQPCDCHGSLESDFGSFPSENTQIPSLEVFEQQLLAATAAGSDTGIGLDELELAGLDASLAALENLSIEDLGGDGGPTLADLLQLLERYPGLKLSLSY